MDLIAGQYARPIPEEAKKVFRGEVFDVWQWPQELFDGSTVTYEALSRSNTVHTVGVLPDGKILLAEDEQPNREPVITPPGGAIEEGEAPEEAARREFLEETGYSIDELVPWHTYRAGAKVDWLIYAFVGRELKKTSAPTLEPGEKVTVKTYTFAEFLDLGSNPMMRDLVIRIILLEAKLDPKKREALHSLFYG